MRILSSVKSLYTAVGILFLIAGLGIYLDFKNEAMDAGRLEIKLGLEKVIRLDRELTSMLTISVLEQNALRAASYDTIANELEGALKTVADLLRVNDMRQDISTLQEGRRKLHALEANVLKLMSEDKWDGAKSILFGDEFVIAKKTSQIDNEVATVAVIGELVEREERFGRIKVAALGMRFGALFLLLGVGVMFSRRTQADLSEQMRLRAEIARAYEAMEQRVLDRTADLRETTARLALENEERLRSDARTRLILNSAGEGIFGFDAEEGVTFINGAAETLLGFTADEVIGKGIHALVHHSHADGTPYPQEDCPMYRACTRGESSRAVEEVLWRKDGSKFLSEYSVTPIFDDKKGSAGAVVVFRDITERKNIESELSRRMEDLERFNRLTMGREERMIQLKQEVNALLEEMGKGRKYKAADEGL